MMCTQKGKSKGKLGKPTTAALAPMREHPFVTTHIVEKGPTGVTN